MKLSLDTRSDLEVLLRIGFMDMSPAQLLAVMQYIQHMQKGAAAGPEQGILRLAI